MNLSVAKIALALALLACLGSFTWATRRFFVKEERLSVGLRLTLAAGLLSAILHFAVIWLSQDLTALSVGGAGILYLLSLAVFWSAIRANKSKPLSACFSDGEQLHLVQHGPYRWMRHPFYTSYLLTWLAGAVATLNIWVFLDFLFMAFLYVSAARSEESKFARSSLAGAYSSYKQTTGRFVPMPWKANKHP